MAISYWLSGSLWQGRQISCSRHLTPEQSQQVSWRVLPAQYPGFKRLSKRCLGKEHRYGACIEWFISPCSPPPGCPTPISHPKHLWFKVSLSQKTTLSFNCRQWILIFLDYLLTLWVLIELSSTSLGNAIHRATVWKKLTSYILKQPPVNYTWWSSVLTLTREQYDLSDIQLSHCPLWFHRPLLYSPFLFFRLKIYD